MVPLRIYSLTFVQNLLMQDGFVISFNINAADIINVLHVLHMFPLATSGTVCSLISLSCQHQCLFLSNRFRSYLFPSLSNCFQF